MNALTMDMALGCSTNSMLHLPAIAHEAGVDIDLDIANALVRRHQTFATLHRQVRLTWKT